VKLRRLAIERLPGIDRPFELEKLADGLTIIVGPNGTGKSRLCAATQALLWPEDAIKGGSLAANALLEHSGTHWRVACDASGYGWQRDGVDSDPPPLPGEHLHACFFMGLRDLLDDSDSAGKNLAGVIRSQMSGGFNLEAVRRDFEASVSTQVGKTESKAVTSAENEIRNAEHKQAGVALQEEELDALETRADDAERAQQRLVHYDTALSLQKQKVEYAQCESDLAALPEALSHLDGKELEWLKKLDDHLVEKRNCREIANNALTDYLTAVRDSRLDEPIESASLATWCGRAERLSEIERDLGVAGQNALATCEALVNRRRALGGRANADATLAIEDDADLFAFLRESQTLATERETLTTRLGQLGTHEFSDEDARRLALLKRATEPLRAWLRAPDPGLQTIGGTLWPTRVHFLAAVVVLGAIGLVLHFAVALTALSIATAGVVAGLTVAGLLSRVRAEGSIATDWRAVAKQQFPEGSDAQPVSWTEDDVAASLRQLEEKMATLAAKYEHDLIRKVEREHFEVDLKSLETPAAHLEVRRETLAERLGLDALQPDAEMVDLARALDALRTAQTDDRSAAAKRNALEEQRKGLLADIATFLTGLGESEPTDAVSARAGTRTLEARDRTLRAAKADAKREEQTRERLDREIEELSMDRAEIFRMAAFEGDDYVALTRLLDQLARYGNLTHALEEHASVIRRAETALKSAGEGALSQLDAARLDKEKALLITESARLGELNRKIGEITSLACTARKGHDLEDAIAKRSAMLGELRDRRDEALAAEAGGFLIDSIRHEHESSQLPRVLERARHHFGAFSHHRYELQVSPRDNASFVAVDVKSGEGLSPDELSDGTRAQLILAVRLAFAEEVEQGADLPLFLDEALDHSDPDRFHAIARSLARMVADDARQVFYFSNDPTDVERFQAAFDEEDCDQIRSIDLAAIRGQIARVDGPQALRVPPLTPVPDPVGESAESYGAAIRVAALDPSGVFANPLYYVLRDTLPVLCEFLEARIDTVGQCRSVLESGAPFADKVVAGSEVGARLKDRIELFETFCLAWCEGRGKSVRRAEIEESGAVSDKYLEAVAEFAAETGGDAERLIATLREHSDERFKGYRVASADNLERFFVESGHLDERRILGEREIIERAIGTPAASQLSVKTAARLLHEWWSLSEPAASQRSRPVPS
jgi:exonuclease SbcC